MAQGRVERLERGGVLACVIQAIPKPRLPRPAQRFGAPAAAQEARAAWATRVRRTPRWRTPRQPRPALSLAPLAPPAREAIPRFSPPTQARLTLQGACGGAKPRGCLARRGLSKSPTAWQAYAG